MGTETKYRVGAMRMEQCGEVTRSRTCFLGEYSAPNDLETFVRFHSAKLFSAKQMASWVQVLASVYPCVLVERVEVAHD